MKYKQFELTFKTKEVEKRFWLLSKSCRVNYLFRMEKFRNMSNYRIAKLVDCSTALVSTVRKGLKLQPSKFKMKNISYFHKSE